MELFEAGRPFDARIAEVMGLGPIEHDYPCGYHPDGCDLEVPDTPADATMWDDERHPIYRVLHENGWNQPKVVPFYSTRIEDAWYLIEWLQQRGFCIRLSNKTFPDLWWAYIYDNQGEHHMPGTTTQAGTAPMAICIAALRAVEAA